MIRQDAIDNLRSKAYRAYSDPRQASRIECFEKIFTLAIFENSKYALGSIYATVLNITRFCICNYYEYAKLYILVLHTKFYYC